ncbi:MAG: dethiobiotin synthase [Gemmatimonadota bacterium]
MIRLAVTGTDTGVGKTVVAAALVALLRARGRTVAGMKPVETGVRRGDPASDAALLSAAAGGGDPLELVCPVVLPDPLAPWIAAERAGTAVDLAALDQAFETLARGKDAIVVEGAGGLLVPLTREIRFDTLFRRWRLDLIVVAADRLGALNHTLLTLEAARSAGLAVRGVVLNAGGGAGWGGDKSNLRALRELLAGVPVTTFPPVADPRSPKALASAAERAGLGALVPLDLDPDPAMAP